jgi:hypothetical protein
MSHLSDGTARLSIWILLATGIAWGCSTSGEGRKDGSHGLVADGASDSVLGQRPPEGAAGLDAAVVGVQDAPPPPDPSWPDGSRPSPEASPSIDDATLGTPPADAPGVADARPVDAGPADGAAQQSCGQPGKELTPCPCRYGRRGDPSIFTAGLNRRDLINSPNERLAAPAGALWWIHEDLGDGPLTAVPTGGGTQALRVVGRINDGRFGPYTAVEVPGTLAAGARLKLGARELSVVSGTAGPPLNIPAMVRRAFRADLGGTGVVITVPAAQRDRVLLLGAFAGVASAPAVSGIQVLQGLVVSQAPSLCATTAAASPTEVFVPIWTGDLPQAVHLFISDTDHFENSTGLALPRPVP